VPDEPVKKSMFLAMMIAERKRKLKRTKEPKMNMTPMMDVVFQLIIFLMLVTEMSKMEIVELTLPKAYKAKDDKNPPPNRVVINLTKDHEIYYMQKQLSVQKLRQLLHRVAVQSPKEADTGLPTAAVKIRADAHVEYKYVQRIMIQCMREFIWQLSFGAMPKEYGD